MVKVHLITDRTFRYEKRTNDKIFKDLISKNKNLVKNYEQQRFISDNFKHLLDCINKAHYDLRVNYDNLSFLHGVEIEKNKSLTQDINNISKKYDDLLEEYIDLEIKNENKNEVI